MIYGLTIKLKNLLALHNLNAKKTPYKIHC